ncbi:hypothetical protein [Simplicispira suum]|uniref:hypothetical protein n=1 Tax=Simplicispira suum TaxID=2109915 RepID=UPI0011B28C47|nr:hypothetical protein [Simplicispira suum]
MPHSTPIRKSASLAALKEALLAEQHVLALDIHIVSARVMALLGDLPCETVSASVPGTIISGNHELIDFVRRPDISQTLGKGSFSDQRVEKALACSRRMVTYKVQV